MDNQQQPQQSSSPSSLESKFGEISSALKSQFSNLNLSEAQIKDAMKSPDDLINLISEKTGMSREAASQKVHELMTKYNISDEQAKGFMAKMEQKFESGIDAIKSKFTH
ncbi:MAG: hypothetical protein J7501_17525 [Bdellovibrio sp.]|nr:hypothetical protein [Bdellovibrio sp.]